MATIGQLLSRGQRQALHKSVGEANYGGGAILAPLQWDRKANEEPDIMKPVRFSGFANTGVADMGDDIVDPAAFTNQTISEFLKFGRQLLFMHDAYSQIGEIDGAQRIKAGQRMFGTNEGGLKVDGFVDSPIDPELGMIPDHPLAKIIHFARMQVTKNRLKLMSIGWRPTKTEMIRREDHRRGGEMRNFRHVKALILGEVSLVTMAMNRQSVAELQKAYKGMYGDDIADALFAEGFGEDEAAIIPDRVDGFDMENIKRIVASAAGAAADKRARAHEETGRGENTDGDNDNDTGVDLKIISLQDDEPAPRERYEFVSLNQEEQS